MSLPTRMDRRRIISLRIAGIEVGMDPSWMILALLVAWSLATGVFPNLYDGLPVMTYWWLGLLSVVGLAVSIVLHELAHSLVARRFGIKIRSITLFVFGGVADMADQPARPRAELLMAAAGPAMSLALAAVLHGVVVAGESAGWSATVLAVPSYLALLNSVLAVFNLVPAFPLDGGRVLRAALWSMWGDFSRATRVAVRIGSGGGILLSLLGVAAALSGNVVGGLWWILIGFFLRSAAQGELQTLQARHVLAGITIRDFVTSQPVTVPADISLDALVSDYVYRSGHEMYPVSDGNSIVGSVGVEAIRRIPRDQWGQTRVDAIMQAQSADNTIPVGMEITDALDHMNRTGQSRLLVTDDSRFAGIVTLKDLLRPLSLRLKLGDA